MRRILVLSLLIVMISSCSNSEYPSKWCTPSLEEFTEADLVGTWVETKLDLSEDTLIIRDDGFYKQIIHIEYQRFEYESDWLPWHLKYSVFGVPYLYLEGYRPYAFDTRLLDGEVVGGGKGSWYDFCERTIITMPPGVGELIVTIGRTGFFGLKRELTISFPGRSPENTTWNYTREEP